MNTKFNKQEVEFLNARLSELRRDYNDGIINVNLMSNEMKKLEAGIVKIDNDINQDFRTIEEYLKEMDEYHNKLVEFRQSLEDLFTEVFVKEMKKIIK